MPTMARKLAGAAVVLGAVHVALLAVFVDPSLWFAGEPIPGVDYHTHADQAWRVLEGLEGWGRSWVYDVQLLAGYPHGVLFDADNKAWELWTFALERLGVGRASAFNSFALAVHLGLLPAVYGAARLLGLSAPAALTAAGLGSALWWLDSWLHWCWWIGMVAYAGASYLVLVPFAFFYRFMEEGRAWQAIGAGVSLALCHLVHPYSFFVLAPPLVALYVRAWPRLGARGHAAVLAIAGVTVAANAYWLTVALRFWHYVLDSAYYGQSSLAILAADLAEWDLDPVTTGLIGSRTSVRLAVVAAAIVGLVSWRRAGDRRFFPVALTLGWLGALAYLGGYSRAVGQIQPYRHVAPLAMLAALPAAAALVANLADRPWRRWPGSARLCAGILAIPALQHVWATGTYFAAGRWPAQRPLPFDQRSPIGVTGHGWTPDYRLVPGDEESMALVAWVRGQDDGQRRFLVELGHLGELLGWATEAPIVGGFTYRNEAHALANLFRRPERGAVPAGELRRYLETYAIGWVIVTPEAPWLDRFPEIVRRERSFGAHVVYRVLAPSGLVAAGGGEARARTNVIEVRGADPAADLVLRFHWLETLACRPGCSMLREPVAGDPVGFIRVPAPHPADLTIENTYEVQG